MGIWLFYLLALLALVAGGLLWAFSRRITLVEWIGGTAVALVMAVIFQVVAIHSMTSDTETWSGSITRVSHYPAWTERYRQAHHHSSGSGKTYRSWTTYTTEYQHHSEYWDCDKTFGSYQNSSTISEEFFNDLSKKFGGKIVKSGHQSSSHGGTCSSGDNSIYSADNHTGYVYPVTTERSFENKIKAAPSLFSFAPVPTNVVVYAWPNNPDWQHSDRLLGTALTTVDKLEFDRMNTRLGFRKRVNIIMVGFGARDSSFAEWQRAKWIGGKKNDIVLCYGGGSGGKPEWARVFSWSDSEICKRRLESILLANKVDTSILPMLEAEISSGYVAKDWSKFDYIRVEPPTWSYFVFFITLAVFQFGFYLWAVKNGIDKSAQQSAHRKMDLEYYQSRRRYHGL